MRGPQVRTGEMGGGHGGKVGVVWGGDGEEGRGWVGVGM